MRKILLLLFFVLGLIFGCATPTVRDYSQDTTSLAESVETAFQTVNETYYAPEGNVIKTSKTKTEYKKDSKSETNIIVNEGTVEEPSFWDKFKKQLILLSVIVCLLFVLITFRDKIISFIFSRIKK
jgi:hypothetical protein